MPTSRPISALLFLLILSGCSSVPKQIVVTKTEVIREKVPDAYLRKCPGPSRKPIVTTGDIIDRLTQTESALATCSAQVNKIRKWNGGQNG